jgi:hypothetical protein
MSLTLIHKFTLSELQRKFTAGDVTATEIVRAYFLRVTQVEPKVNAYLTQCKEAALAQAERLDQALKGWRKTTPMMAMPLAVKDNICTEGVRTTCASRMLDTFVPPYDATVVAKLRAQIISCSARRIWTNLRWGRPPKIRPSAPAAIPGTFRLFRADRAAARRWRWRLMNVWRHWGRIPAVPFASLRRSAASSG